VCRARAVCRPDTGAAHEMRASPPP
jgi:hypothetical protein